MIDAASRILSALINNDFMVPFINEDFEEITIEDVHKMASAKVYYKYNGVWQADSFRDGNPHKLITTHEQRLVRKTVQLTRLLEKGLAECET